MSDIESRIEALERKAGEKARLLSEREQFCGVIPFFSIDGTVYMCWDVPCDHIPALSEMPQFGRCRATCPDAAECQYAGKCRACDRCGFNSRNSPA